MNCQTFNRTMIVTVKQRLRPFGVFVIYLKIQIFSLLVVAVERYEFGTGTIISILDDLWHTSSKTEILNNIFFLHFSPRERQFNDPSALATICEMSLSTKPVNCFDWSPDRAGLAVCSSFDKTLRVIVSINMPLGQ